MDRRKFIQTGSLLTLAALGSQEIFANAAKLKTFGCQLYSVRDYMAKDPIGTMRKLAAMGYRQFESYSGDPLWGMSVADAKSFLKEINVDMVSAHSGLKDITDQNAEKAKAAGIKYLICPHIGGQKSADEWLKRAEEFNKAGEICKKHGLKFGYHNHAYSFETKEGVVGQDILLQNTDPKLVVFELDIYWTEAAKVNAADHLTKYKGRYELCHIKQLKSREGKPQQADLAEGILDFNAILKSGKKAGLKYYFVEQEEYPKDSLLSMENNVTFMKTLSF